MATLCIHGIVPRSGLLSSRFVLLIFDFLFSLFFLLGKQAKARKEKQKAAVKSRRISAGKFRKKRAIRVNEFKTASPCTVPGDRWPFT